MTDDLASPAAALRYYRTTNEAHERCMVLSLGARGFCAELSTVARAMVYAWGHQLQLVLDSREFAYAPRSGWTEYFEPFCPDASEIPAHRIVERFRFTPYDRAHFVQLRKFAPQRFRFGSHEIAGEHARIRHFLRLIFRLRDTSRAEIDRRRRSLGLPLAYVALHVRRGDKVGDEDVLYPADRYLRSLDVSGDEGVFVMSDDHETIAEVQERLAARGYTRPVATLCRPEHTGFSVDALQAGERFASTGPPLDEIEARHRYIRDETNRLLAEIVVATSARRFVSTFRSNVGKTVWYLHDAPDACHLLRPSSRPAPPVAGPAPATSAPWRWPRVARLPPAARRPGAPRVYASLTSIFANQARLLETLESILAQSRLPDAVFVHLSTTPYLKDEGFRDGRVTHSGLATFLERHRERVHVRWVENTGPYRKLLPLVRDVTERGLPEERHLRIVTLDDDVVYHPDTIASLLGSNAPSVCLRGFRMRLPPTGGLNQWGYWKKQRVASGASVLHFATGVGGVLYTLPVFEGLLGVLLDATLYRECCPTNDDIWFNLLRIANRVPMTVVDAPYVARDLTNHQTALFGHFNEAGNNPQIRATAARLQALGVLEPPSAADG